MLVHLYNPTESIILSKLFNKGIDKFPDLHRIEDESKSQSILIHFEDIKQFTDVKPSNLESLEYISISGPASLELKNKISKQYNVKVFCTPGQAITSVSERNLLLTLSVMQNLNKQALSFSQTEWKKIYTHELKGKIMGFWGFGNIANYLANIYIAMGMKVITSTSKDIDDNRIQKVNEKDLLEKSDILNMQLRLSKNTQGILDKKKIQLMKEGSIFINTARAELTDVAELYKAIESKKIAGAGLDVFEDEPLKKNHPLFNLDNVVITPHSAWRTEETVERFIFSALTNLKSA
ncbi:MAG: hypothetical protein HON42_00380 [Alphaproteobacteria bacterium]|nr:hypothetical protein [Alphaproteobacteria bacterium]